MSGRRKRPPFEQNSTHHSPLSCRDVLGLLQESSPRSRLPGSNLPRRMGSAKPVNTEPKREEIRLSGKELRENFPKEQKRSEFFDLPNFLHPPPPLLQTKTAPQTGGADVR